MTRVLFVTPHAGGNVPPTVAVAARLVGDGHDVRVLGHPGVAGPVTAAGVAFRPFVHARPWSPHAEHPGVRSMLGWLRTASDRGVAADVAAELDRARADVVVVDCMTPVALRPARAHGAAVVLLLHSLSLYWTQQWSVTRPVGLWLRLTRTHPGRHPADLAVVTTAPELDPVDVRRLPAARVAQTGPVVPEVDRPSACRPDDPVLVSFSTISYPGQDAALQRALDAVAQVPVTAVATVPRGLAAGLRVPAGVEVRAPEPHGAVLPGVRLLVGHGGHGTTTAALAHGVPVLVVAMSSLADQPLVGAAVERAGAGLALPRRAPVEAVRDAVRTLLADPGYAARAEALGRPWRDGSGARRAAEAVLGAAAAAGPVGDRP